MSDGGRTTAAAANISRAAAAARTPHRVRHRRAKRDARSRTNHGAHPSGVAHHRAMFVRGWPPLVGRMMRGLAAPTAAPPAMSVRPSGRLGSYLAGELHLAPTGITRRPALHDSPRKTDRSKSDQSTAGGGGAWQPAAAER
ncbi:hypothetical protein F511_22218 [Dorcoceras hygrometricum]|uniref:Uncharacterized protein n=1 Tax=Dorcoceras hygrometricum TaxID=472368 RepID=A0A2Z7CB95_9LAMI|nr:hypothetical protein F511_22218 [Dorcoceras hygrometricum]